MTPESVATTDMGAPARPTYRETVPMPMPRPATPPQTREAASGAPGRTIRAVSATTRLSGWDRQPPPPVVTCDHPYRREVGCAVAACAAEGEDDVPWNAHLVVVDGSFPRGRSRWRRRAQPVMPVMPVLAASGSPPPGPTRGGSGFTSVTRGTVTIAAPLPWPHAFVAPSRGGGRGDAPRRSGCCSCSLFAGRSTRWRSGGMPLNPTDAYVAVSGPCGAQWRLCSPGRRSSGSRYPALAIEHVDAVQVGPAITTGPHRPLSPGQPMR